MLLLIHCRTPADIEPHDAWKGRMHDDEPDRHEPDLDETEGEVEDEGASMRGEENIAIRIRMEREARSWGTSAVSEQMNAAGYEMNPSAVWRIENGKRRINVNEAIGFADIFGISLENLVGPPRLAAHARAMELIEEIRRRRRESHQAALAFGQARDAFDAYLDHHPEIRDEAEAVVQRVLVEDNATLAQPYELRAPVPATDGPDSADA